jgi:hypothetical protein
LNLNPYNFFLWRYIQVIVILGKIYMGKIMPDLVAAIKNIISNITQNTLEKLS